MNQKKTIKALTSIQLGYQFRSKPRSDKNGSVRLIQIKDILADRSGINQESPLRFEPDRDTSKQLLRDGDILFMGKGSAPFACKVNKLTEPTVACGMFFVLKPDTRHILPDYLAWILNSGPILHRLMIASGTGVAMPVIRRKELERLEIPLPSLETQQWIGELQALKKAEQDLMGNLAKQKEILAEAVCMNLIEGENQ